MADDRKRKGAWAEVKTFSEPNTGLTVVVSERIRGRPAYSYQVVHVEPAGSNKFIQHPVRNLDKVPVEGDQPAKVEDVIKALVKAAREFIEGEIAKNQKLRDSDRSKKPRREKGRDRSKPAGGLSSLARQDAEAKGVGEPFVGPTQRKKQRRTGAK